MANHPLQTIRDRHSKYPLILIDDVLIILRILSLGYFFSANEKEQMFKIQQRSVLHQICVLIFFYHGNRPYIAITCIWTLMASSEFSFDAILANIVGYWPNNPQTFPSFSPVKTRHILWKLTQFEKIILQPVWHTDFKLFD